MIKFRLFGVENVRKPYPSDVADDEWAFVAPYLLLMTDAAPLPTVEQAGLHAKAVYDQVQRWIEAGVFEDITYVTASRDRDDLRKVVRTAAGKKPAPTMSLQVTPAAIIDSQTLRSIRVTMLK